METTVNKNTRHQKLSTRYRIFLLEQFSKYRKEIFMSYVVKLSINIKLKFSCMVTLISIDSLAELKTDLDQQCFQKKDKSGFSRTRVKIIYIENQ